VRLVGLEPTHSFKYQPLRLARLPFRHNRVEPQDRIKLSTSSLPMMRSKSLSYKGIGYSRSTCCVTRMDSTSHAILPVAVTGVEPVTSRL
jgi:hypothetical protein